MCAFIVLRAELSHVVFCETAFLNECTPVSEDEYELECRCGGRYSILMPELRIGLCVFTCSNCSLRLCINEEHK